MGLGANHGHAGGRELFLIQAKLASRAGHCPYHTLSRGACPALAATYCGAPAVAAAALPGPCAATHPVPDAAGGELTQETQA
ncbi:MAG TPA: hypothetical protein VGC99_01995 [Candidatus Tectomicrobia bacterium]